MENEHRFRTLFWNAFIWSACTSVGHVTIALMRKKYVDELHWLEEEEMTDLITISQSTPGPVLINASVLVGYRIGGLPGALLAILGTTLPPLIIMSLVTMFYELVRTNMYIRYALRGMQTAAAALLLDVTITMFTNVTKQKHWLTYLLILASFIATAVFKINVLYIALVCILAGIIKTLCMRNKQKKEASK